MQEYFLQPVYLNLFHVNRRLGRIKAMSIKFYPSSSVRSCVSLSNFAKDFSDCLCWVDLIFCRKYNQGELYRIFPFLVRHMYILFAGTGASLLIDTFSLGFNFKFKFLRQQRGSALNIYCVKYRILDGGSVYFERLVSSFLQDLRHGTPQRQSNGFICDELKVLYSI